MRWIGRGIVLAILLGQPSGVSAEAIGGVPTGTAGFVGQSQSGPLDQPTLVTSYGGFLATFGGSSAGLANPHLAPSIAAFFANGGARCYVVRVADANDASLIGVDAGPGLRTGLQALRDVDEVSIVAIPGATTLAVQTNMIALCESEGDRVAILDPGSTNDVSAVLAQRAGLGSAAGFAALYFPWVQAAPAGTSLLLPPSGFVAGVYARTAAHDSPVGSVATATGLSLNLSASQQDALNVAGVDALREFTGQGILVWGARTISSDPEWRYVAVRRTALYLEESIGEGTEWAILEPNDPILWTNLRSCVEDFLYGLFVAGWFPGITPDDAYFVRVDASTMTQTDIDEGRTILLVGFAPVTPSEFMLLRIVHQRPSGTAVSPAAVLGARLLPAVPNPFHPRTEIHFDLSAPGTVRLEIYDLAGRRVRTLQPSQSMGTGRYVVPWAGDDDRGAPVASGTYVVRLDTGIATQTGRITLVR